MIAWQPPTRFPFRLAPRLQLNHAQLVGPQTLSLIRGLIIDSLCPDLANKSLWRLLTTPPPLLPFFSLPHFSHSVFHCPLPFFSLSKGSVTMFSGTLFIGANSLNNAGLLFFPFLFYSPWRMKNNLAAKARQAACGCPCPTRLRIHSIWARKEWIKINDGQIFTASLQMKPRSSVGPAGPGLPVAQCSSCDLSTLSLLNWGITLNVTLFLACNWYNYI